MKRLIYFKNWQSLNLLLVSPLKKLSSHDFYSLRHTSIVTSGDSLRLYILCWNLKTTSGWYCSYIFISLHTCCCLARILRCSLSSRGYRVTRILLKPGGELRCSGRISSSCSTSGTRRVNLVTNPAKSREWGKEYYPRLDSEHRKMRVGIFKLFWFRANQFALSP
jgi:hypothetical protein